ncbi:MAG: hypothetical protein ACLQUY_12960 [Ktedonobacterales bacterium]
MATAQVSHLYAAMLLTQECESPGCNVAGDQFTMVRCRDCGGWFCPQHVDAKEGVTLIHVAPRVLRGLGYYQGICTACRRGR